MYPSELFLVSSLASDQPDRLASGYVVLVSTLVSPSSEPVAAPSSLFLTASELRGILLCLCLFGQH